MEEAEIKNLALLHEHIKKAHEISKDFAGYLDKSIENKKVNLAKVKKFTEEMNLALAAHVELFGDYLLSEEKRFENKKAIDKKVQEMQGLLQNIQQLKKL